MKEKVLLAVSDQNLAKVLIEHLTQKGHGVESVIDGDDVIGKMKSMKPDLLLIDTVLPHKSGYDVLNEKSFDKEVTKIPVIIISNTGEPIHMKQIPSTPAIKDYIIKTHVNPDEVVEKIEKTFGRALANSDDSIPQKNIGLGRKILWVEDDKLLSNILSKKLVASGFVLLKAREGGEALKLLSNILSKKLVASGFVLLKAHEGGEALKLLEQEIPKLIILDIMLPGMNGMDVLQKIKMIPGVKSVPVMILSNLNRQSDIEKAKLLGANRFLVKAAVSLDEVVAEVEALTESAP